MAGTMSEPDYLDELTRLTEVRDDVDDLILKAVKGARKTGISWYKIGPAMGVTHQAAHQRFASKVKRG
jgi:hypothetical protein